MIRALALAWIVTLAGWSSVARAQQVSATVTMRADRTRVAVGERLQLTIEARCQGASDPQVQLPSLEAFDVVGRRVSQPFSLRFGMGGGMQQVQSTVRHVLTLQARSAGRFELDAAVVELAGQRFSSQPLTLEVADGPGGAQPTQPGQAASGLPPPGSLLDGMEFDPSGFIRTWVEPAQPYVGQQATVSVYLYVPQTLRGNPAITQEPSTDGFWVQDLLPPSRQLRPQRQAVNGRSFEVYLLRRFAAFALSAEELTIGPTEVTIDHRSVFDVFGMGARPREPWVRRGVPVTLDVQSLPAGRPDGPVHVGTLAMSAELDRSQIATGDAVTLTLTATGSGAIEQLRIPDPAVDGLRVLRPEIRDTIGSPNDVVSGSRILRWLIVPERPGTFTIGPIEVAVFAPESGTFSVARADALTLVAAGSGPNRPTPPTEPDTEPSVSDDEARASFGPVRTHSALMRSPSVLSEQPWFLTTLAFGPLLLLFGLVVQAARRRAASDDPKGAPRRARKAAKRRLAAASGHMDEDEPRAFYAAVASALKELLEAKLARPVGSLTHPELRAALGERGMEDELAERIVNELEGCDFARFSAVGVSREEMASCLDRARGLLVDIDRFRPTTGEEA